MKQVDFLWNRTVVVVVDKLSSTSVDFNRSERELEKLHLYGVLTGLLSMLRASLGGVKSENPRAKGKLGNEIFKLIIKI